LTNYVYYKPVASLESINPADWPRGYKTLVWVLPQNSLFFNWSVNLTNQIPEIIVWAERMPLYPRTLVCYCNPSRGVLVAEKSHDRSKSSHLKYKGWVLELEGPSTALLENPHGGKAFTIYNYDQRHADAL
jgi:hypothetical protein